ncbi:MAG TPA: hypothetical protein ENH82_08685 [bacterium]|nr:hypothetical protein [bacterium]
MALTVEINRSGFQDISDYIVSLSGISYIRRNRDWTPVAEDISMSVSYSNPYDIIKGDAITIKDGSTTLFYGLVHAVVGSADTRTYNCKVKAELLSLEDYLVEYDQLHTDIANNGGDLFKYDPSDDNGYPVVNILWLMQKMFEDAGLTLDISLVEDEIAFSFDFPNGGGVGVPSTQNVQYKRFALDENEMYCINQDVATFHTTLDADGNPYHNSKITHWDLIQEFCSAFKFSLIVSGVNTYQLSIETANYTIADADAYSHGLESIDSAAADVSVKNSAALRANYKTTTKTALTLNYRDGFGSKNIINFYNNLFYFFYSYVSSAWTTTTSWVIAPQTSGTSSKINPIQAKVDKVLNSYIKETVITTITTTRKSVVQNILNLEKQTSKIIQES